MAFRHDRRLSFARHELTGALGDSITVLPIVASLAALTDARLSLILLGFAVFQIVWGVRYGLPLSVEPMKALAALAIGGALTYGELATAGVLAGGILLVVGTTGALGRVEHLVPPVVVRGVQFAVALLLLRTAFDLARPAPLVALAGVGVALAVSVLGYRRASALAVLAVGFAVAGYHTGVPTPSLPAIPTALPPFTLDTAVYSGVAAQLAMTVGNAAVATSLLLTDLYDADVSVDALATSMGITNLVAVPLGAIPMCHGSGGLAGKHAFGARTGGANVILGVGYALLALVATGGLLAAFPLALLGVLLAAVALELGTTALTTLDTRPTIAAAAIGGLALLTNVGIAFIAGLVAYHTHAALRR